MRECSRNELKSGCLEGERGRSWAVALVHCDAMLRLMLFCSCLLTSFIQFNSVRSNIEDFIHSFNLLRLMGRLGIYGLHSNLLNSHKYSLSLLLLYRAFNAPPTYLHDETTNNTYGAKWLQQHITG